MKKTRLILLSALTAMSLTSCSLFNDDDVNMKIENHFNSKEEASAPAQPKETVNGVGSQDVKIDDNTNALLFKSMLYSNDEADGVKTIKNTYTTANGFAFNINNGEDYVANKTDNNFDLYIPDTESFDRTAPQTIVLFIHGGAWVSGLKTHVNPYVKEFVKRGFASATIEYSLLSKAALTEDSMDAETLEKNRSLSIFRDLERMKVAKENLIDLGFTGALNLVIGGVSSGAHLTMLYSYSRGNHCPLPIKFIVNAVGPTDIRENVWKAFNMGSEEELNDALDDGIEYPQISALASADKLRQLQVSGADFDWNEYQTMRIANGMCGFAYTPDQISATTDDSATVKASAKSGELYQKLVSSVNSGEKLLSVTNYITSANKIPMICAYAGMDTIVGIGQFANLQKALESNGYVKNTDYTYFYFKTAGHINLDKEEEQTTYNAFINQIDTWLKA